ncbi:MAG: hypothetical protein AAGA81_07065 [Acidobacteriota bacterium]
MNVGPDFPASPPSGSGIVAIGRRPARVVILPDAVATGPVHGPWITGVLTLLASLVFFAQLIPSIGAATFGLSSGRAGTVGTILLMLSAALIHRSLRIRLARHELAEVGDRLAIREVWKGRMLRYQEMPLGELRSVSALLGEAPTVILETPKGKIELGHGLSEDECRWLARTLEHWRKVDPATPRIETPKS